MKRILLLLLVAGTVTSCSNEMQEMDSNETTNLNAQNVNPVAQEIGHGLSNLVLTFENLPQADKALFDNTVNNPTMGDNQKISILSSNNNTNAMLTAAGQVGTSVMNHPNFLNSQANANQITNVFLGDIGSGPRAQNNSGCEAALTVCLTYGMLGCAGFPICVAGVSAICLAAYGVCVSEYYVTQDGPNFDLPHTEPLFETLEFYRGN